MTDCEIETFESIDTLQAIKQTSLNDAQQIFLSTIRKIFFQPGAGRQEDGLRRGLGAKDDKKKLDRILSMLVTEGLVTRDPGRIGWLYHPQRKYTARMAKILAELNLSKDELWERISEL